MSSLLEKVKDKLHGNSDAKTEQPEGTHGSHSSRTANAADPRIDSDRDHREALGHHDGSYSTGGDNYSYGESNTSGTNTAGDTLTSSGTTGPAPTTAGMHKSDMLNKVDPRIDSDLDGSRNMGLRSEKATHAGSTITSTAHATGTSGTGTSGTGSAFGSTGPASKTAGTHKSDIMNKADPKVDSDLDGSRNMGLRSEKATYDTGATTTSHGTGTTSTGNQFTSTGQGYQTAGEHKSDTMNKADPRIDSDLDGSRNMGLRSEKATYDTGATTGNPFTSTGQGYQTAGEHKSDTMNKADPRIDSDLDGSRNMGLRSEKATHDLGSTRTTGMSGATGTEFGSGRGTDTFGSGGNFDTSGTSDTYTGSGGLDQTSGFGGSGTDTYSTGLSGKGRTASEIGSISTDRYGQPAQHTSNLSGISDEETTSTAQHTSNLGSVGDETTSSKHGGMGSLGGGFGTDRQATGPASNTAGPHKSDMMNKADPRVDSDLDNSKTFGGDKTYQS